MTAANRPSKVGRATPVSRAIAAAMACALLATSGPASAQRQPPPTNAFPVIRDTEIEQLLRDYTNPLLRAAGLAKQNVQVVLINERSFNAFVIDGRRIFVNTGALMESETPNQIIGVLAHETGHIAGGHLAKMREQLASGEQRGDPCDAARPRRDGGGGRGRHPGLERYRPRHHPRHAGISAQVAACPISARMRIRPTAPRSSS